MNHKKYSSVTEDILGKITDSQKKQVIQVRQGNMSDNNKKKLGVFYFFLYLLLPFISLSFLADQMKYLKNRDVDAYQSQ